MENEKFFLFNDCLINKSDIVYAHVKKEENELYSIEIKTKSAKDYKVIGFNEWESRDLMLKICAFVDKDCALKGLIEEIHYLRTNIRHLNNQIESNTKKLISIYKYLKLHKDNKCQE